MSADLPGNAQIGQPADTGPPNGDERRSKNRMPDTDWLTGTSSRAAFARQVGQADQDRDQFAVAIIGLRHIDEINRHLGFGVGDGLLQVVGRALGERAAVGTTVARLGGAQFGMMTVGLVSEDVSAWLEPVVSGLSNAIAEWIFEQIDFNGSCPIEPKLMIGAAGGFSGRVWADAAIALDVCETDKTRNGQGGTLAIHDPSDYRFASVRERELLNEDVLMSLDNNTLRWAYQSIERCQNPNPLRPWFRIAAIKPGHDIPETNDRSDQPSSGSVLFDPKQLRSAVGTKLERAMVDQAAEIIADRGGQTRVTVPLSWLLRSERGVEYWMGPVITGRRIPASRFVFEVTEADVADRDEQVFSLLADLVALGAELAMARCSGGAATVAVLNKLPFRYLKPDEELVRQAERGNRAAARVLHSLIEIAADNGGDIVFADCRPDFAKPGATTGFQEHPPAPIGSDMSERADHT